MRTVVKVAAVVLLCSNFVVFAEQQDHSEPSMLTESFIKRQVEQSLSPGRAVSSIIRNYPSEVIDVVSIALDLYPDKYREIIYAAVSAQPSSSEDIVTVAIEKGITECTSIVETAIAAEPSYVNFVVNAAANSTPGDIEDIVRIAVVTEPDSADRIVQSLSQAHPNKMVDILATAMGAVPYVGEYMVDALLAVFPAQAEEVITTAVRESHENRAEVSKIIDSALSAGVDRKDIKQFALNAGLSEDEVNDALKEK
ncbi:hypothetical protein [Aestuariibacter salexigens]|uniref:hypothetical protein n=1 Tax=Aestuariibacter salexigens TaxID=226010 RepID=UPI000411F7FA|nr:hypothetical protein [Aestuariibacter salexigens]